MWSTLTIIGLVALLGRACWCRLDTLNNPPSQNSIKYGYTPKDIKFTQNDLKEFMNKNF